MFQSLWFRPIWFQSLLALAFAVATALPLLASPPQKPDSEPDKNFDVRSSLGDVHVGKDADARKTGLPLYPGARLHPDSENSNAFNLGVLTEAFGIKLVIARYDSDDAPEKVISYYRDRLKKYGKVLECHAHKHDDDSEADTNSESKSETSDPNHSKALKCEGDGSGPVTELKVGFEDNQHVVTVEPRDGKGGTSFALFYVHTRGKQGDI